MSEENKEVREDEWGTKGDAMWALPLLATCFGYAFPQKNNKNNTLEERVARLEGQMDMIRR